MRAAKASMSMGPGRAIDMASTAATVVLLTALTAGAVLGVPALQQRVAARQAAHPVRVLFDWPVAPGAGSEPAAPAGTWLDVKFQTALAAAAGAAAEANPDPLGPAQLAAISEAAMRTGWFARPPVARREGFDTVRVSGEWNVQAAVVRRGDRDRLIGWGGELLPLECPAGESGLPVIVGVSSGPPVDHLGKVSLGSAWAGEDVSAALELLAVMLQQDFRAQVRGIEVSDFGRPGRGRLVVLTERGRVVWGARVGESAVERGEVSTERKLLHMRQLFTQTGRIDGGRREVDVRSQVVIVDESATGEGP